MPLATRSWIRTLALFFPVSLAAGLDEAASSADDETRCLLESKVAPWLLGGPDAVAVPLGGGGAEAAPADDPVLLAFLPAAGGAGLDLDPAMFVAAGGEVVRRTPDVVLARVPLGAVLSLAASPSIGFVRPPVRPVLHKVAATRAIGARLWQDGSSQGGGVKLGIIDVEYWGHRELFSHIGLTRYHTWAPEGSVFGDQEQFALHGTACAELVHSVAPEAELYLAQVGSDTFEADFGAAFDWLESQGVSIVSVSLGVSGWYHDDGTSPFARRVDQARERGILCCVAAGNEGDHVYWAGRFLDADGDEFHEFVPGAEGNGIELGLYSFGVVVLTWDGGERTAEDLDLGIYNHGTTTVLASSSTRQTGEQPAIEAIIYATSALNLVLNQQGMTIQDLAGSVPRPYRIAFVPPGVVDVRVRKARAVGDPDIRVYFDCYTFVDDGMYLVPMWSYPERTVAGRSIGTPADAAGGLAVGAVETASWDAGTIAYYSSQGPTSDGRIKPDLVAPTRLVTRAYDPDLFEGTSTAAPLCAGAAALVSGLCPEATPERIRGFLTGQARDLGASGADPVFGAGALRLPDPVELRWFSRGRVGADGTVDIADAIAILSFLFRDGTFPPCLEAADVDDSGVLDITDGIALLGFLFLGSERPPAPFDSCCPDLTPDDLGCETPPECE